MAAPLLTAPPMRPRAQTAGIEAAARREALAAMVPLSADASSPQSRRVSERRHSRTMMHVYAALAAAAWAVFGSGDAPPSCALVRDASIAFIVLELAQCCFGAAASDAHVLGQAGNPLGGWERMLAAGSMGAYCALAWAVTFAPPPCSNPCAARSFGVFLLVLPWWPLLLVVSGLALLLCGVVCCIPIAALLLRCTGAARPATPAQVAALPELVYAAGAVPAADATCGICLAAYAEGDALLVLPCPAHHVFHKGCVGQWLQLHATCPNDRCHVRDANPPPQQP